MKTKKQFQHLQDSRKEARKLKNAVKNSKKKYKFSIIEPFFKKEKKLKDIEEEKNMKVDFHNYNVFVVLFFLILFGIVLFLS